MGKSKAERRQHAQTTALVTRIRNGDVNAFDELDSCYRNIAHQLAIRVVGDAFEADDVVQEALYRAYANIGMLSNPAKFGPWLATIVRNVAIDHVRSRLRGTNFQRRQLILKLL